MMIEIKVLDFYPNCYGITPYTFMPFQFSDVWFAMSNENKSFSTGCDIYDLRKNTMNGGILPVDYWTGEKFKGSLRFPDKEDGFDVSNWVNSVFNEYGSIPLYDLYARNENGEWAVSHYGIPVFQSIASQVFNGTNVRMSKRKLKHLNTDGRVECANCGGRLTSIDGMGVMFNHCSKCEG